MVSAKDRNRRAHLTSRSTWESPTPRRRRQRTFLSNPSASHGLRLLRSANRHVSLPVRVGSVPTNSDASFLSRSSDHPTAAWTAQQLRNAFPYQDSPSYLLHDRDGAFAGIANTLAAMQIHDVATAPRSPWQNAYVERFIGSIRRECLDHVIVFSAAGLERIVHAYVAYYMRSRTHLSLEKDSPTSRPVRPPTIGRIVAQPEVNGLHHRYDRAA